MRHIAPVLAVALVGLAGLAGCSSGTGQVPATATDGGLSSAQTRAAQTPPERPGDPASPTGTPVPAVTGSLPGGPTTSSARATGEGTRSLTGRTIVIDPGHNGRNGANPSLINRQVDAGGFRKACNTTGTAAGGVTESSVNLRVAELLAQRLRDRGATVVLTRPDDAGVGPCVDERGMLAGERDADLLVSIHADGAAGSGHGFHVIAPGPVPGYTDGIVEPSRELAVDVRDGLTGQGLVTSTYTGQAGLVTRADLGTLNHARVPAVMVELGNLHNDDDFALLTGPAGQARYADGLTAGVAGYLD